MLKLGWNHEVPTANSNNGSNSCLFVHACVFWGRCVCVFVDVCVCGWEKVCVLVCLSSVYIVMFAYVGRHRLKGRCGWQPCPDSDKSPFFWI